MIRTWFGFTSAFHVCKTYERVKASKCWIHLPDLEAPVIEKQTSVTKAHKKPSLNTENFLKNNAILSNQLTVLFISPSTYFVVVKWANE